MGGADIPHERLAPVAHSQSGWASAAETRLVDLHASGLVPASHLDRVFGAMESSRCDGGPRYCIVRGFDVSGSDLDRDDARFIDRLVPGDALFVNSLVVRHGRASIGPAQAGGGERVLVRALVDSWAA